MFMFDPLYWLFIGPTLLFALWASMRTRSTFQKYSQVAARTRMTGAQVARRLLDSDRLTEVAIEKVPGQLTDNYDPRSRVLHLSESVHDSSSIAAIGVAAHEMGHALQHADAYRPLVFRQAFHPVAAFASKAWVWLFIISTFLAVTSPGRAGLQIAAVACLSLYALFAIITLPVEFNASRRALLVLDSSRTLDAEELAGAKKVLDAAALTYVASAAQAVMMVLWLLARSRDR